MKQLQDLHLGEAEAAAERMHLPSPSAIRSKFKGKHSNEERGQDNNYVSEGGGLPLNDRDEPFED